MSPPTTITTHSWASCSCLNSPQIQNSYINIKACEVCIDQDFAKMVYEVPYRMIAGDFVRSYPTKVQKAHLLRFQCGWQQASAKWWTGWLFSPPNIQFIPSWSKGSYKKWILKSMIETWKLKHMWLDELQLTSNKIFATFHQHWEMLASIHQASWIILATGMLQQLGVRLISAESCGVLEWDPQNWGVFLLENPTVKWLIWGCPQFVESPLPGESPAKNLGWKPLAMPGLHVQECGKTNFTTLRCYRPSTSRVGRLPPSFGVEFELSVWR